VRTKPADLNLRRRAKRRPTLEQPPLVAHTRRRKANRGDCRSLLTRPNSSRRLAPRHPLSRGSRRKICLTTERKTLLGRRPRHPLNASLQSRPRPIQNRPHHSIILPRPRNHRFVYGISSPENSRIKKRIERLRQIIRIISPIFRSISILTMMVDRSQTMAWIIESLIPTPELRGKITKPVVK